MTVRALLDSNVMIAAIEEEHKHHRASSTLINSCPDKTFAVAAHSVAETYSVLTNPALRAPYRWPAREAWVAIEKLLSVTVVVGLTHGASLQAIRAFAAEDRVGPLLYDRLIGEAAIRNGIGCILTWNVKHMRGLFPNLIVSDPASFGAEL